MAGNTPQLFPDVQEINVNQSTEENMEHTHDHPTIAPTDATDLVVKSFLNNMNTEGSRRVYAREVEFFLAYVKKPLSLVDLDDVIAFKSSLKGLKTATIARKLVIVKAFLGFAHEMRVIVRNPARLLKVPRVHSAEPVVLTVDEAQAMLRSPDRRCIQGRRDHAVLALLMSAGLRESELCALDVADVTAKWSHHVVTVRHGKGGKPRSMSLADAVSDAIAAYLELRGQVRPDEPLFLTLGKRGLAPTRITPKAVDHLVAVHARRALISKPVTTHLLRHCAVSFALANGASPREVMEMAGHSSLTITNRYAHLIEKSETSAARQSPLFR